MYFVESVATTRKTLLYISKYSLHNLYSISNAFRIFASLVINILQFYKTIIASWSPEKNFYTLRLTEPKEKIFYTLVSYGAKKKNLYLAYDSENGLTNN